MDGYKEIPVTAELTIVANFGLPQINDKLKKTYVAVVVYKVWSQLVAG